jgi:hypothetical protein
MLQCKGSSDRYGQIEAKGVFIYSFVTTVFTLTKEGETFTPTLREHHCYFPLITVTATSITSREAESTTVTSRAAAATTVTSQATVATTGTSRAAAASMIASPVACTTVTGGHKVMSPILADQ